MGGTEEQNFEGIGWSLTFLYHPLPGWSKTGLVILKFLSSSRQMMAPQWVAAADLYPLSQAIADAEPRKPQLLKTILNMCWNLYQYQIKYHASYITYIYISYIIYIYRIYSYLKNIFQQPQPNAPNRREPAAFVESRVPFWSVDASPQSSATVRGKTPHWGGKNTEKSYRMSLMISYNIPYHIRKHVISDPTSLSDTISRIISHVLSHIIYNITFIKCPRSYIKHHI